MNSGVVVVVGNAFDEFARVTGALTAHEAVAKEPAKSLAGIKQGRLLFGQGVTPEEAVCSVNRYSETADPVNIGQVLTRASPKLSHKKKHHNTLIGTPKKVGEQEYVCDIHIDERSELMSDHQTGLHIQGMLQVEAFRQMMLAVFEEFFPLENDIKAYAVINRMDTAFGNFLFPLPAIITCNITELDINERRTRVCAQMRTIQNETECATAQLVFTFYPASVIASKETDMALKAFGKAHEQLTQPSIVAGADINLGIKPQVGMPS